MIDWGWGKHCENINVQNILNLIHVQNILNLILTIQQNNIFLLKFERPIHKANQDEPEGRKLDI